MTSDTVPEPLAPPAGQPVGLPLPGATDPAALALVAGRRV